ncbi:MAG: DUF2764 family protein [Candidatus Omnitrophota bacterium]|jgi:hypothetical protein
MSQYYTYLVSSLPTLVFGVKPPFSFEVFIQKCESLIPDKEIGIIKRISSQGAFALQDEGSEVLKKWKYFDINLRNELVKVRAARKKVDPLKYLRHDEYSDPQIVHIASLSLRNHQIFEAERALDLERWRLLDELSFGRYFDFDTLIIYALKLNILDRWAKIEIADKERIMQETTSVKEVLNAR